MRCSSWLDISLSLSACPTFAAVLLALLPPAFGVNEGIGLTLTSLNVFHCPQAGHFPIHLGDSCPQFEQTYAVLSFAIFLFDVLSHKITKYFRGYKTFYYFCTL
jgi:hypothetical protein